ncbi:hypothetical protein C8Q72DRAFT_815445 [Fomitopsis betulina]|nr:hypothetical protein C8Q72DRAFT_815445 [Fomitopsis betulina]
MLSRTSATVCVTMDSITVCAAASVEVCQRRRHLAVLPVRSTPPHGEGHHYMIYGAAAIVKSPWSISRTGSRTY